MADPREITLRTFDASPTTIVLYELPVASLQAETVIFLSEFDATPSTIILRDFTTAPGGGGFPTQFFGLRVYDNGAVQDLCLVATADANSGNQLRLRKGGTTYAVYLVDTSDGNASTVRIRTGAGVRAIRRKT